MRADIVEEETAVNEEHDKQDYDKNWKVLEEKWKVHAAEPDLIATEMLAFPSQSSKNEKGSDPINEKTTPL